MTMRITADPNHLFEALANQELAGKLSETFEPLCESDESTRVVNDLAESIQREISYQYWEGVLAGRKAALEFLGNRFAEMATKMPDGYSWFAWTKAFLVAGYECCMTDKNLSHEDSFWRAVDEAYKRDQG